ncbi:unnamed protein product [Cyclocybe aegerita]|uniref:HAT C-terminal dimerisation domain-containing protein n=1 Tax=Cyclocybe aegerita TaxID=1973307 RepID=A0A8S0VUQ8_CYCAE|nr:unnamed protein product [Cyclocybe aegerita]
MITGDKAAQEKARKMIAIIKNPVFWQKLTFKHYLEPLAIAANITQASFCHLDQVLITFGYLLKVYLNMNEDPMGHDTIITSLELRWSKADQELFISAIVINPFYCSLPFSENASFMTVTRLESLLSRLWMRLNKSLTPPPTEFTKHAHEFLTETGHFQTVGHDADQEIRLARDEPSFLKRRQPDPIKVLEGFCLPHCTPPIFITFCHQLLSVSANLASCEHLFSIFGNILTKLRTRLSKQTLIDLSEVKMDVCNVYIRCLDKVKTHLKRHFGPQPPVPAAQNPEQPHYISTGPPHVTPSMTISGPSSSSIPIDPILMSTHNISSPSPAPSVGTSEPHAPGQAPNVPSPTSHNRAFRDIVNRHTQQVEEDNTDNEPVRVSNAIGQTALSVLFNMQLPYWVERYEHFARLSYDDELELYNLLDLDADGKDELDNTTQEILANINVSDLL